MNARNRGLSVERQAGARTSAKTSQHRLGVPPAGGDGVAGACVQLGEGHRVVEGRGVEAEPLERVVETGLRGALGSLVEVVHGGRP